MPMDIELKKEENEVNYLDVEKIKQDMSLICPYCARKHDKVLDFYFHVGEEHLSPEELDKIMVFYRYILQKIKHQNCNPCI